MAKSSPGSVVMARQAESEIDLEGTRALLRTGGGTLAAGVVAALLCLTVFGPVSIHGPRNNGGWLALMVAMMCLPFGLLLFALGFAKWLRNRHLRRIGG